MNTKAVGAFNLSCVCIYDLRTTGNKTRLRKEGKYIILGDNVSFLGYDAYISARINNEYQFI